MRAKIRKAFTMTYEPRAMSQRGFTLIELAMVLVVIGLLIGLGAGLIGPLTKRAKLIETRETVNQAKEAFLGYVVKNGYLPAKGTYDTTNPVAAFQIVGAKGIDAWTKPLRYIAANELEKLEGHVRNACGVNTTTLTITDKDVSRQNIAFMIISSGGNYNIQTETTIYEIDTSNIDDFTVDINRLEECLEFKKTLILFSAINLLI